jgi:sugar phosphate isomerase/epimerase
VNKGLVIGTLIRGTENPDQRIRKLAGLGFEGFSITFWESLGAVDLSSLSDGVRAALEDTGTLLSSLSVYGNPLREDETGLRTRRSLELLIDHAPSFGCPLISTFAGRRPGLSVNDSIEPWKRIFTPLMERAYKRGLRLAFENCRLGDTWKTGNWNIAINPDAWELMDRAIPSRNWGLEWEPCHQVEALADPLVQLDAWADRIYHIHGKDARIDRTVLALRGVYGPQHWYASCFPGNGDTDWVGIFSILKKRTYEGTVDVEGWNDALWSGEQELEGQRRALNYLKECRLEALGARP